MLRGSYVSKLIKQVSTIFGETSEAFSARRRSIVSFFWLGLGPNGGD